MAIDADEVKIPSSMTEDSGQQGLRTAAGDLERTYLSGDDPAWADSAFDWIRKLPPARRGRAGLDLVDTWAQTHGIPIDAGASRGWDRRLAGMRAEVKMSTQWATGEFVFQQIEDGPYDVLVLLGLSPERAFLWIVPRATALAYVSADTKVSWISFHPSAPPAWLTTHGGDLLTAARVVEAMVAPT